MDTLKIRQANACRLLRETGCDKALIGDPMSINYLTGVHVAPYERFYGIVLDAKSEELTMINPSLDTGCMKGTIPEAVYQDSDGPMEMLRLTIGDCKKLAVEKKYFSMHIGEMLSTLDCPIEDVGECITKLRMSKDGSEIEYLQHAAYIVDETIAYVSTKIKPGMTEKELNMMIYTHMSEFPGFISDEFHISVLGATNSANPHGVSSDYAFCDGDIILMDFDAYYKRYWSDITRCVFVGRVGNPKLAEIYEIVVKANLAAIAQVRPGISAKSIDKAARDIISEAGYGDFFLHRTGHGLGLSVHEEPYITSVNELILEPGMVFTVEPGIYIEGLGGVRIEDDVLVTEEGHHVLTKASKNLDDHIIRY